MDLYFYNKNGARPLSCDAHWVTVSIHNPISKLYGGNLEYFIKIMTRNVRLDCQGVLFWFLLYNHTLSSVYHVL